MVKIKATSIKTSVEWRIRKFGQKSLDAILDKLSPEDREFITSPHLFISDWIPLGVYTRYIEAVIDVSYNGDEVKFSEQAEDAVRDQLSGLYRALIRMGSPMFIMKRYPAGSV